MASDWQRVFKSLGVTADISIQPRLTNILSNRGLPVTPLKSDIKLDKGLQDNPEHIDSSLESDINDTIAGEGESTTLELLSNLPQFGTPSGKVSEK